MLLYLIDGNSLLSRFAGLNLSNPDDQMRLMEMLQIFSRIRRTKVEVFFGEAPAGQAGGHTYGPVRVHAVLKGQSLGPAIRERLTKQGNQAKETLVVTSDREVQSIARAYHAPFLDSQLFARELSAVPHSPIPEAPPAPVKKPEPNESQKQSTKDQPHLSRDELDEWLDIFKPKGKK